MTSTIIDMQTKNKKEFVKRVRKVLRYAIKLGYTDIFQHSKRSKTFLAIGYPYNIELYIHNSMLYVAFRAYGDNSNMTYDTFLQKRGTK